MPIITIITPQSTRTVAAETGATLHDALAAAGLHHDAVCGGRGTCGRCLVDATGGLSQALPDEARLLSGRTGRLACHARIIGDCTVTMSPDSDITVQTEGDAAHYSPQPWVDAAKTPLGIAVDIGTTTVVVYLYDLPTACQLAVIGETNRQRARGADVISRITYTIDHPDGLAELRDSIRNQLNDIIIRLLRQTGRAEREIGAMTVAGNTVMCHLFRGFSPACMAFLPFTPDHYFGMTKGAARMGLPVLPPDAMCHTIRAVAGYVGGDITAAVIAAGLHRRSGLLIDVGTNGEMVLSTPNGIYCCATAAGPAFEGVGICCGMPGAEGAVERVWLEDGAVRYAVIGGLPPRGICGSGLIDAVAVMLELGAIDETGRLLPPGECGGAGQTYITADGNGGLRFNITDNVFITDRDIRQIQIAKAAIAGGIRALAHHADIDIADIGGADIAGGFGAHINAASAARIGLYPKALAGRTRTIGNAAGTGAGLALTNKTALDEMLAIAQRMEYLELSSSAAFQEFYVDEMMF